MSSGVVEPKGEPKGESRRSSHIDVNQSEILVNRDLMNDAVDGENREHEMGMWAAVKSHPWACLWAFTMSFTIVRLPSSNSSSPSPNPAWLSFGHLG